LYNTIIVSEIDSILRDAVQTHRNFGIYLAQSDKPNFNDARAELSLARDSAVFEGSILRGRIASDLGVVSVREGLYRRAHEHMPDDEALEYVESGVDGIKLSYTALKTILNNHSAQLRKRQLEAAAHGHICATMNTWLRAVQTAQLLDGEIGPQKQADQAAVDDQWMLGRGKLLEPGAWTHGKRGDDGYAAAETAFLGLRAERINGGAMHMLKGIKWGVVRGLPELGYRLATDSTNRAHIAYTAGQLAAQSFTRNGAIAAALDYQRF
jgi:hypothetical protein